MKDELIRVHCVPQEYWYLSHNRCDCDGKLELTQQELVEGYSVPVDRMTVKCDNCGKERVFHFDLSAFFSAPESSPMAHFIKFVNGLSNDGDVLGVEFLQEIIDTARTATSKGFYNHVLREFGGMDGVEDRLAAEEATMLIPLAEKGDPQAQVLLGFQLMNGQGVPEDQEAAVMWFQKAAEQGNALAQAHLGAAYFFGTGVPQDDVAAVRWFQLAAEQGKAIAQHNLGESYAVGRGGLTQDDVTAYMWCILACDREPELIENEEASGLRESLKDRMTPEQLAEAQRLAREWDEAHPRD